MVRTLGTLGIIDVFICPGLISFLSFSPFLSARLTHFPEREEVRKKKHIIELGCTEKTTHISASST